MFWARVILTGDSCYESFFHVLLFGGPIINPLEIVVCFFEARGKRNANRLAKIFGRSRVYEFAGCVSRVARIGEDFAFEARGFCDQFCKF